MKKNFFAMFAVIVAIAFSSFTSVTSTTIYMVHRGTGFDETTVSSYTENVSASHASGLGKINWFKIIDNNDGDIDQSEFNTRFEVLDVYQDTQNKLSDEEEDIDGELDVKS